MSKTLWHTIKLEVPKEMINITKNDKVVVKKTLTKSNNISKRAKKGTYPKLEVGDNVRVPVIHKQHKGYKDSFSMETHKIEDVNKGLYTVDGSFHPRKDLQLVKGNVIKAPTKTKTQQKQHDIQDKVGKSLNNPEVKDLVGTRTKKQTKEILNSERKTRAQTVEAGMTLRSRKK